MKLLLHTVQIDAAQAVEISQGAHSGDDALDCVARVVH